MGEARRRGSRDERIAQAVYRHQRDEAARMELRKEQERQEFERIRNLPPEIRKEVLMRRASPKHRAALLMASAAMALAMSSVTKGTAR